MTDHPGDNADNRFRSFWAGLLGFVSFGVVLLLALRAFGPGGEEVKLAAVDQQIVDARKANLEDVRAAQSTLISDETINTAVAKTAESLAGKKAVATELVVPNSPTFLKQMTEAQAQAAAEPDTDAATEASAAKEKPAEEKPEN